MSAPRLNSEVIPNHVLERMSATDRRKFGKAGMTAAECREKFQRGEENKLQSLVANFLNLRGIYFETDRMDRRTSGKKGRPDFRICYRGRWIAVECKADGGVLSPEQVTTLAAIRKSGGVAIVAFGLPAVQAALRELDAEINGGSLCG